MQAIGAVKPPLGVIFDSDLGNHIDDVLAMALLYGLDGKNECRVVSTSISKSSLEAAALSEVIGRFYAGAVSGSFGAVGRALPVGLSVAGLSKESTPILRAVLDRKTPEGQPVYAHGIEKLNDTAEVPALIRNAYTSQHDAHSVTVLAGPATNLVTILKLPGVRDLVTQKCRALVWAATRDHLRLDPAAARTLLADWPTPIYLADDALGAALPYPGATLEANFAWAPNHPIADAYRAAGRMPYDAPTAALSAVLYAVHPDRQLFTVSAPGAAALVADGTLRHTPGEKGTHYLLTADPAQRDAVLGAFTTLTSAKPVPRRPRRPPVEVKPDPAKPDPAKPDPAKP